MANRGILTLGFIFCFLTFINSQVSLWNTRFGSSPEKSWLSFGFNPDSSVALINKSVRWYDRYPLHYVDSAGAFIAVTPLVNLSLGVESGKDTLRYQNSRGVLFLAGGKNLQIHALLVENQALFASYQQTFVRGHGEFYPNATGYLQSNGMVPGEGRTKPYKGGGVDYLYSRGGFQWRPTKKFMFFGGNQQLQIGYGTRSLFWGDHNQAFLLGAEYHITDKLSYLCSRGRLFDLIRKPLFEGVESSYYNKGYSFQGLVFKQKIHEACLVFHTLWNGGSLSKDKSLSPWFWAPLPGFNYLEKMRVHQPQIGACYKIQINKKLKLYSEVFTRNFKKHTASFQVGGNMYYPINSTVEFRSHFSFIHTGTAFYGTGVEGAFSHNNLPLGSILGNGVDEFQLVNQYRFKRLYFNHMVQYYTAKPSHNLLLLPSFTLNAMVFHQTFDVGIVINIPIQLVVFGGLDHRIPFKNEGSLIWWGGIKTHLFQNHHAY
jgi:hypothetical protein